MSWIVLAGVVLTFLTAVIGAWQTVQNKRKIQEVSAKVNNGAPGAQDGQGQKPGP